MSDDNRPAVTRRELMALGGSAFLFPDDAALAAPAAGRRKLILREGTNLAAAASPDGKWIAFDLLGVLWLVEAAGGAARRLTDDLADIAQLDWSPDGREIVFQSYRDGNFHLWIIGLDGAPPRQLTRGPFDSREPRFSPDGRRIAFASDRTGSYGIHVLDRASGEISVLVDSQAEEAEPAWSPDGGKLAFTSNKSKIEVVDAAGNRSTIAAIEESHDILSPRELHAPAWTPDGKSVLYTLVADGRAELHRDGRPLVVGEDVFPFRVTWLPGGDFVYGSNGLIRRRGLTVTTGEVIGFTAEIEVVEPAYARQRRAAEAGGPRPVIGIGSPVLSPDGTSIAFRALNDIWTVRIGEPPVPLTNDRFHKSDPAWSPDGSQLVYSSDRGGKLDLWIRDIASGADRQLTHLENAAVSAAWSPDGRTIAFLDQTGSLHTIELAGGAVRKLLGPLWEPAGQAGGRRGGLSPWLPSNPVRPATAKG